MWGIDPMLSHSHSSSAECLFAATSIAVEFPGSVIFVRQVDVAVMNSQFPELQPLNDRVNVAN
jgi:hypothetical protein